MDYGITIRTPIRFAETVARVREALKAQVMVEVAGQPSLKLVGYEATSRIRAALDSLKDSGRPAR